MCAVYVRVCRLASRDVKTCSHVSLSSRAFKNLQPADHERSPFLHVDLEISQGAGLLVLTACPQRPPRFSSPLILLFISIPVLLHAFPHCSVCMFQVSGSRNACYMRKFKPVSGLQKINKIGLLAPLQLNNSCVPSFNSKT